ncbi:hypothetical protein B0H13DRAFT_1944011 [Mycena leptocephala]|nr:hypothetical protein B0H13DRAFT_1944011 [Mycena leptocephala]
MHNVFSSNGCTNFEGVFTDSKRSLNLHQDSDKWRRYERRRVPELKVPKVPQFLERWDNIAYVGDKISLDLGRLIDRLENATGRRYHPHPYPVLDELYTAYDDLFASVAASIHACDRYLKWCMPPNPSGCTGRCRSYYASLVNPATGLRSDPRTPTTLEDLCEQIQRVRTKIAVVDACWAETVRRMCYGLDVDLQMWCALDWVLLGKSIVFPWSRDSHRRLLQRELLPIMEENARLNLARFGQLYESLESDIKQIESARVGAPDVDLQLSPAQTIPAVLNLCHAVRCLLSDYRFLLRSRMNHTYPLQIFVGH